MSNCSDNKVDLSTVGGGGGWDGVARGGCGNGVGGEPMETVLEVITVFRGISMSVDSGVVVECCVEAKLYNHELGCPVGKFDCVPNYRLTYRRPK